MERRQKIYLYDSRLQVIMPGDPEHLDSHTKLRAPENYKPQSRKGRAILKQTPRRSKPAKSSGSSVSDANAG